MFSKFDPKVIDERRTSKVRQQTVLPTKDQVDKALFEELRLTRTALARVQGVPPYVIFSDKVLTVMAKEKPTTFAEFSVLYGVGEFKAQRYWRPFTDTIRRHLQKQ